MVGAAARIADRIYAGAMKERATIPAKYKPNGRSPAALIKQAAEHLHDEPVAEPEDKRPQNYPPNRRLKHKIIVDKCNFSLDNIFNNKKIIESQHASNVGFARL